jgi:hypothetical protein
LTYRNLLLLIDEQQTTLQPSAFKLLVHLIATGIRHGSNAISIGGRELAEKINVVRDTVHLAAHELAESGLIRIHRPQNLHLPKQYVMPAEWFTGEPDASPPAHEGKPLSQEAFD